MRVAVIGTGYVGLVVGAGLSDSGNDVVCVDIDEAKIERLRRGEIPIYEPGLEPLVKRNLEDGRLSFGTDVPAAVREAEVIFIAVGTPPGGDGSADLQHVLAVAETIGRSMNGEKVVITKSTVPVGTARLVRAAIEEHTTHRVHMCSNPEFLKEGAAVDDFMKPDRVVVGVDSEYARDVLDRLYSPFVRTGNPVIFMDIASAEITKYAANAMLATRISFMNELANLAGQVGVDIEQVRKGIGSDRRIGYSFLYAGTGYGGSCFPKDVRALIRTASKNGRQLRLLEAVEAVNELQKIVLIELIRARFGDDLKSLLFGVWGLAFKPNTDDMREAPSRVIVRALLERGAHLVLYDPVAMPEARRALARDLREHAGLLDRLRYAEAPIDAAAGADALVIVTEWQAFKSPNFTALKKALKSPVIFDGRNLYEPAIREQGFEYHAIGR
jgi:UDPglucose 6-dehydrogenase